MSRRFLMPPKPKRTATSKWAEIAIEQKRKVDAVSAHYHSLEKGLAHLRSSIEKPYLMKDHVDDVLNQLQRDADGIKTYLSDELGQAFTAGAATEASEAKMHEVFGTPELLELILIMLHPKAILVAQQVSKGFDALITTSPKIQQYLGLRPDPTSAYATPFDSFLDGWPLFSCRGAQESFHLSLGVMSRQFVHKPDEYEISASFSSPFQSSGNLPRLGDRCLKMLVCQPPIYEMKASVSCCNRERHLHPTVPADADYPEPIRSETGITVGDLLETTRVLINKHRTCPHASVFEHDEEGYVRVAPTFKGVMRLEEDDPALRSQQEYRQRLKDQVDADVERDRKLQTYMAAKRQAQNAGTDIPTLRDFLAQSDNKGAQ